MVFSSVTFLCYFLPAFLVCYYCLPARNLVLLLFSLFFYAWGEPRYLPLLLFYILINWAFGLWVAARGRHMRWVLAAGIASNLALLLYFKYCNFLLTQLNTARHWLGLDPWQFELVPLALGISFFTFQGISYLVDVFRADVAPQRSLLDFATYKAMFPQLVAGPIVRYSQVAGRLGNRTLRPFRVRYGMQLFVLGLSQKVLIANTVAVPADKIFGLPPGQLPTTTAWLGVLCYTLQIYFDFAGYSNMAIGMGHMMGFRFPANFNRPYIARSITEFWRRWHMSLSSWFRDYLYIPLGGNRGSGARTYLNLVTVFLLCGLWHGAQWTFLLWGAYHGLFLVVERMGLTAWVQRLWRPLQHVYLLLAVMVGWVLFRCDGLHSAIAYLGSMIGLTGADPLLAPPARFLHPSVLIALVAGACFSVLRWPEAGRSRRWLVELLKPAGSARPRFDTAARLAVDAGSLALLCGCVVLLASGTYNPFIYFRF